MTVVNIQVFKLIVTNNKRKDQIEIVDQTEMKMGITRK